MIGMSCGVVARLMCEMIGRVMGRLMCRKAQEPIKFTIPCLRTPRTGCTHMADQRRYDLERLKELLEGRRILCFPEDLERLVDNGFRDEHTLGAASVARLMSMGLKPALADTLGKTFGAGRQLRYLRVAVVIAGCRFCSFTNKMFLLGAGFG